MKNSNLIFFLAILFLLTGCGNNELVGHYTGSEAIKQFYNGRIDVHSFIANDQQLPFSNDATFVDFFNDGTYVMNFNHFEYGEYELLDSIVTLKNSEGKVWKMSFGKKEKEKEQVFFHLINERTKDNKRNFYMNKMETSNSSDYPYTLENNRWRIWIK